MDFTSLTGAKTVAGSIALWVNNTQLDTATILTEAQALIYQTLRCREMIVSDAAIVVAQGAINAPLPSDFLDPLNFRDLNLVALKLKHLNNVKGLRGFNADGITYVQAQPRYFALTGTTVEFDCAADVYAAGTYLLDYFGAPAALSAGNPTNFLTIRYPALLRAACMAAAADFLNDEQRVERYTNRVAMLIADVEANDDLAFRGGEVMADYSESRI